MSVFKRGDRWWFTKTINGNRIRKPLPTARTKAMAEEAERHEVNALHRSRYGGSGDMLLSEFIDKVYLPWARTNKRHPRNDEMHAEVIKDYFKKKTFNQVSPLLIEKFKRERRESITRFKRRRAPASVNRELEVLGRIFTMAQDNGIIESNPCRKVKKLRQDNQRNRFLTADEEERLLSVCVGLRSHLRPIITVAVNTGMRKGDLLGLTWQQVDFERGLVFVANKKAGDGRGHFLPMNSQVLGELVRLHAQRTGEQVFNIKDVKKAFATACRLAGIINLRFHDLRHTAATRLAEAGADAFTIAAILGHSTIQMSARYTHIADDRKRQALEAIARVRTQSGHNEKEAPALDTPKLLRIKVSRGGLEPPTRWLKASCSTT
jgi:integrase